MKKLTKYTLIATVFMVVFSGGILGYKNYRQEQEAKQAFNEFYQVQDVKGISTVSGPGFSQAITFFTGGFIIAAVFAVLYIRYYHSKKLHLQHEAGEIKAEISQQADPQIAEPTPNVVEPVIIPKINNAADEAPKKKKTIQLG